MVQLQQTWVETIGTRAGGTEQVSTLWGLPLTDRHLGTSEMTMENF